MKNLLSTQARQFLVYFLASLILVQTTACRYFNVRFANDPSEISTIFELGDVYKYFIVHSDNNQMALKDITLDSLHLSGNITQLEHPVYYEEYRPNRYRKHEKPIVHEVHIYLKDYSILLEGEQQFPVEDVREIRIIEQNTGKTVASYVFSTLGILAGAYILLVIIILLTKSSCPYIYVDDGDGFVFEGETFGGAIMQNQQRDDYMPLPSINPVDGTYRVMISNELKERQYTDQANLIVVNHGVSSEVLLDKHGSPQVISNPQKPVSAITLGGEDMWEVLEHKDREVFMFNETDYNKNELILNFEKPADSNYGKLVFNAKNSLWLDYLFGKFNEKFGKRYNSWMEKRQQDTREERLQKELENGFPLSVHVKIGDEWKLVDYLHTVGPLADRDFVVPVDLSEIEEDQVIVKFSTGFMFWELDQVAMDFSPNTDVKIKRLLPLMAMNSDGKDVTSQLKTTDGDYLAQEMVGQTAEIRFAEVPVAATEQQSVFLHANGYYELIREYEGAPKIGELTKFKTPGYFMEFSKEEYLKFLKPKDELLSAEDLPNAN
ncbi:MAG: hypothetical protein DWQ02_06305 [Bacteroidetes bacterium]|nr:MAG: hypothetical protein DWQ02_06305 [Bacteroidota bacterium]